METPNNNRNGRMESLSWENFRLAMAGLDFTVEFFKKGASFENEKILEGD